MTVDIDTAGKCDGYLIGITHTAGDRCGECPSQITDITAGWLRTRPDQVHRLTNTTQIRRNKPGNPVDLQTGTVTCGNVSGFGSAPNPKQTRRPLVNTERSQIVTTQTRKPGTNPEAKHQVRAHISKINRVSGFPGLFPGALKILPRSPG